MLCGTYSWHVDGAHDRGVCCLVSGTRRLRCRRVRSERLSPEASARVSQRARAEVDELTLRELRQTLALTQQQVADKAEMTQSELSRLESRGARVAYNDPYVRELRLNGSRLASEELMPAVAAADLVVIVTDHSSYPYRQIVDAAQQVLDTRNATKGIVSPKIVKL